MTDTLTLTRPDDWHIHFRDGASMQSILPDTARVFGRAIVMPNLKPPVVTVADAAAYRERLLAAAAGTRFEPLMTLYLTDNTSLAASFRPSSAMYGLHCASMDRSIFY